MGILVGNKIDLDEKRMVKENEALEFAKSQKFGYIEVSAKTNSGIDQLFREMALSLPGI